MTQSPTQQGHMDALPFNKVTTVVETKEELDQAIEALLAAGFPESDLFVHHGEQGRRYLDPDGDYHSFLFRLRRKYQRLQGTEKRMLDDADAALDAGHYLLGIQIDGSEELQVKVLDTIQPFTDRSIYFCGRFTIIILSLGKG